MSYTRRSKDGVFEILVREHEAGLLAFVRSCVDDDAAADDLVQETFLAAWRQLDQYDTERPFARWLRGIARNKILEYFRSATTAKRHVRSLAPEMIEAIAEVFEPLTGVGDGFAECLDALRGCLHKLHTTDHDIVRSVYLDGQTCGAIAGRMGRNTEVIKKRLQRARAQLRECIISKLGLGGVYG